MQIREVLENKELLENKEEDELELEELEQICDDEN